MKRQLIGSFLALSICAISVFAQSKPDEQAVQNSIDAQVAANKRLHDLFQKPDFITLRLTYGTVYGKPVETQQPYAVGDRIWFQLFLTQSLPEKLTFESPLWQFYDSRPELIRDGDTVEFSKSAAEKARAAEQRPWEGSSGVTSLSSGREYEMATLNLEDWYDRLGPGHYQLSVRKRFVWDGEWVESNAITFEVVPRKLPDPIPAGISLELVPQEFQEQPKQKLYRLAWDSSIVVIIINSSKRQLYVPVFDNYYASRPHLYRDGVELPYTEETTKLLRFKEENPSSVDSNPDRVLGAGERTIAGLELKKWYGKLTPGVYKLVSQQRLEIDGPWTSDSSELWFEIVR